MRIACVSDTHLQRPWIPDADILIHAGDLTTCGSFGQVAGELTWLRNLPHKHKVIVAGNHDWLFQREPWAVPLLVEGLTYVQNSCVEIEGLRIYGSPYTPYFEGWAFNVDRDRLTEEMYAMPEGVDVLVTHGPPLGIMDRCHSGGEELGCSALRAAVERVKPKLHIFGHIHPGFGQTEQSGTRFINAAYCRDDGGFNTPVVIDL